MLGHNDTKTTLRYTRSDVEDVRAAMEAVEKSQSRHTIGERGRKRKAISNLRPSGHLLPKQALYQAEPRPALRIVRVLISSGLPRNHCVAGSARSNPQMTGLAQVYAWRHPRSAATTPPAAASRCNSSNTHPTRSRR
jgi:hypothetical protein